MEHAVDPIKQGYRLVLTYNLISSGASPPLAQYKLDHSQNLGQILSKWRDACEECEDGKLTCQAYILKHEYTISSLATVNLKGHDQAKWHSLRQACQREGFTIYLAQLTFTREGGCDEDECYDDESPEETSDWDDLDAVPAKRQKLREYHELLEDCDIGESYELPYVFDESGRTIGRNVKFNGGCLVQDNQFEGAPDAEDYSGFTGNEGTSATHFYRRACVVLVPRRRRVDFEIDIELGKDRSLKTWTKRLMDQATTDKDAIVDLQRLCRLVMAGAVCRSPYDYYTSPRSLQLAALETAFGIPMALGQPSLLVEILAASKSPLNALVFEQLGKAIARDGLVHWRDA